MLKRLLEFAYGDGSVQNFTFPWCIYDSEKQLAACTQMFVETDNANGVYISPFWLLWLINE